MKSVQADIKSITSKFSSPENEMGLGKLVYIEELNETVITNGKSLVTFSNSKLSNNEDVTNEEKFRINTLVTRLIHLNFGEQSSCELVLNKADINDILNFVYENITGSIELVFDKNLEVLLIKSNERVLVKIINSNNINKVKCENGKVTVDAIELYNVLDLIADTMNESEVVCLGIQKENKPLMIECDTVKSCITSIK